MNQIRNVVRAASAALVLSAGSIGHAQDESITDLKEQIRQLDQKLRVLERKVELGQETSAEKAKAAPVATIGASGFSFRSADTNFVIKLRGLLQADSRWYADDGGIKNNDTFLLRRARPIFEGTIYRDFDFLFVPEFGGTGTPSILDAYLNYRYSPGLQFRIGKFKVPVGLEQLQSDSQAYFIERGYPSQLTPNRDLGLQIHGELFDGGLHYAAGVFNGVGDNRTTSNADFDDEKEVAGRLFTHPFLKSDIAHLKGLGLGVGASYGNSEGANGLPSGNGFVTDGVQQFFNYTTGTGTNANVTADGDHWRVSPQAYYYHGPFGLLAEYVVSSQKLLRTAGPTANPTLDFLTAKNTAWQIEAGWVITGEDASYKGVTPRKNFSPRDNTWGAFELVARYGQIDIDDNVFKGPRRFANPANAASESTGYGLGLNWYLNRNARAAVNYFHTEFDGGDTGSNLVTKQDENVVLTRFQLAF